MGKKACSGQVRTKCVRGGNGLPSSAAVLKELEEAGGSESKASMRCTWARAGEGKR